MFLCKSPSCYDCIIEFDCECAGGSGLPKPSGTPSPGGSRADRPLLGFADVRQQRQPLPSRRAVRADLVSASPGCPAEWSCQDCPESDRCRDSLVPGSVRSWDWGDKPRLGALLARLLAL